MAFIPSQDKDKKKDHFEPKSSFIESASWDSNSEVMTLTFKSGSSYNYAQVGQATWLSFKQSPNHSSFYSKAIKGRLTSIPVIRKTIGKPIAKPLESLKLKKRAVQNHGSILQSGIKRSLRRAGLSGPGTVPDSLYS